MKIGLLTYHAASNFGAQLQTLSTVKYFQNLNYEIIVINWQPVGLTEYYKKGVREDQRKMHEEFIKRYLPVSRLCKTSDDIKQVIAQENIEAIIIGSDAVFSYIPFLRRLHLSRKTFIGISHPTEDHLFPNRCWGDFLSGNNRIKLFAMSASAQYFDIEKCFPWTKKNIAKALERFTCITVRDRWTQSVIHGLTNNTPDITPDPVFAFNDNLQLEYHPEDIYEKFNLSEKYVLLSYCSLIYEASWYDKLYAILRENGYRVVSLPMPEGNISIKSDIEIKLPLDPLDWYNIIRYSAGYIGQRMHPMIVAFHNLVPFVSFDHYAYKKGKNQLFSSKIYDLLDRAGLLSNYINIASPDEISPENVYEALHNFDRKAATTFVSTYKSSYDKMMNKIISLL